MGEHTHEYSVETKCMNCGMFGINLPDAKSCGNCGSYETVLYLPPCCFQDLYCYKSLAEELAKVMQMTFEEWPEKITPCFKQMKDALSLAREMGVGLDEEKRG